MKNTNDSQWKRLFAEGKLYKSLSDGIPRGMDRLIAWGYPLALVGIFIANTFLLIFKRPKLLPLLVTTVLGSIVGIGWGIWMNYWDANQVAWIFHPWGYSGVFWILALEDWLFYPLCGIFFCLIMEAVPDRKREDHKTLLGIIVVAALLCLFFGLLSPAGFMTTMCFGIPGTVMLWYLGFFDSRHFAICFTLFVAFACGWDYLAVTWIREHYAAWAEQWAYVLFSADGVHSQSKVFLDFKEHSWAWIGFSPIEITPWFSISGTLFIYPMYKLIKEKVNRY